MVTESTQQTDGGTPGSTVNLIDGDEAKLLVKTIQDLLVLANKWSAVVATWDGNNPQGLVLDPPPDTSFNELSLLVAAVKLLEGDNDLAGQLIEDLQSGGGPGNGPPVVVNPPPMVQK
jgi:hypothetical protein